jgi:transposase
MITLESGRIFLCCRATDMRKGFRGLSNEVLQTLGKDPRSGDAFVFIGKNRRMLKVLRWDSGGFWCCARRLSTGKFSFPVVRNLDGEPAALSLSAAEWALLLDGILLRGRVINGAGSVRM